MGLLVLAAKAAVASVLLVGGGAKLADLAGFAAAVRLLMPSRLPAGAARAAAPAVALAEAGLGAASLAAPAAGWLNPIVFMLACGFAGVSGFGYARHRGRACHCFGALSSQRFDARGLARSAAVTAAAGAGLAPVPPLVTELSSGQQALLFLAGLLVALGAFSAARALSLVRTLGLEAP